MTTVNTFGDLVISHSFALIAGVGIGFVLRTWANQKFNQIFKKTQ